MISANFIAVYFINEGSLIDPLFGIGARKGESVSIRSLSIGIKDMKKVYDRIKTIIGYSLKAGLPKIIR